MIAELGRRDADGVAWDVYEAGAVLQAVGRADDVGAEPKQLLLLADRAVREWVPSELQVVPGSLLIELARQPRAVRSERDALDAAQRLREIRAQLRRRPASGQG